MGMGYVLEYCINLYINLFYIRLALVLQSQLDFPDFLLGTRTNQYKNTAATILKMQ